MKRTWKAFCLAALLVSVSAGAEPEAPADPSQESIDEARAHFNRGTELYKLARYEEAIAEFEAAQRARPHPVIFFNLGQCYEKLGRLSAAIASYRRYLEELPNAEDRERVSVVVKNLEDRLSRAVQPLTVNSAPPGAEVTLDGELRGVTPWLGELTPGAYKLELFLERHHPIVREVKTSGEQPTLVDVILTPDPNARSALVSYLSGRRWTWLALGASALAVGAGGFYGIAARRDATSLTSTLHEPGEAERLYSSALRNAQRANVLYAVGAALGAAGVTLFFIEGSF